PKAGEATLSGETAPSLPTAPFAAANFNPDQRRAPDGRWSFSFGNAPAPTTGMREPTPSNTVEDITKPNTSEIPAVVDHSASIKPDTKRPNPIEGYQKDIERLEENISKYKVAYRNAPLEDRDLIRKAIDDAQAKAD